MFPTVQAVSSTSNPRSSFDIAMVEASKSTMRTNFADTSLPEEAQQKATSLSETLQKNPYAYASHVELVNLLHQGFSAHVYPPDSLDTHGDPQTYDLLDDLRKARENMDKLFAVGEDLWLDWIKDESMLARTMEERIVVTEMCARAVQEEQGSTKLWIQYGDWVLHCYELVHDAHKQNNPTRLSQEDMIVGEAAFDRQLVLDTWKAATHNTKWRIDDSHLVWDRYIELVMEDLKMANSEELIDLVKLLFEDRIQYPHANWEGTFSMFSTFITEYCNHNYEHIMAKTRKNTLNVRLTWDARERFEAALQKTQELGNRDAEYNTFVQYTEWEKAEIQGKRSIFELANALFERAALRFPSDTSLWEDHAIFMIDETYKAPASASPLSMLDRATRHCPWSGSLWSQYLLSSERAGAPFTATEEIKHKATNTGLLDVGGMDEVLKVHTAWCSYLRRRAFRAESNDEDLDVAEMGIRSSIENMQELANNKYGEGSNPDPLFRLQRIYIKYLSESGSWDSARDAFRGLAEKQGDSWQFWLRFYVWEMMRWARFVQGEKGGRKTPTPQYATAVLKEALKRPNLDWPEMIMDSLTAHCEDHEDVEELQLAIVEIKKATRLVAQRRAKEAAEAAAVAQAQAQQLGQDQVDRAEVVANGLHIGKRKRDDTEIDEPSKKSKGEELKQSVELAAPTTEKEVKRDREHASVKVQNLPKSVTETRVRQFFRDCGTINSLKLLDKTAVIEFNEKEEAIFAQSRDGKDLDGSVITVQLGTGSILWVTNFPPAADEGFIRDLFEKFGQIVDIRFPSLQHNTHRRFCYVEFERNDQAKAASDELDGHQLDDGLKLIVKISDPGQKQSRSGAMEERREIYIRNIDWSSSEEDLEQLFSQYGIVESARIIRQVDGQSKGFGFVVFSSPDEAGAALAMNGRKFKSRELHVEVSSKVSNKRQATLVVNHVERPRSQSTGEAASPSGMSTSSTPAGDAVQTTGHRGARTVALMNVPDTVNDSRIKELAEKLGGPLVKVSLRPDHQGAILEYVDERDAGKAHLQLDGYEIAPGRTLRVGPVREMLQKKAEFKNSRILTGKALQSAPIKRPVQQTGRGGGRLGQKRGGFRANGSSESGKSNDDFRAMLAK
jgi:RNA recognition motif-containing protein